MTFALFSLLLSVFFGYVLVGHQAAALRAGLKAGQAGLIEIVFTIAMAMAVLAPLALKLEGGATLCFAIQMTGLGIMIVTGAWRAIQERKAAQG